MPKVTYLVPTSGVDNYLEAALRSIDVDPFRDKSIVVVDNTQLPTPPIGTFIERLKLQTRTHIVRCETPGVASALNAGLDCISSEYVARMDGDDLVMLGRTQAQVEALERQASYAGVGSSALVIDRSGGVTGRLKVPGIKSLGEMANTLRIENPYIHPSVMMRTSILAKFRYSEWAVNCQDWELWVRLALAGHLVSNLPECLIKYRRHSQQISVNRIVDSNADALRRTLTTLDPSLTGRYLFQRTYLETQRPTATQLRQILVAEVPKLSSAFATRKLMTSLVRTFDR